MNGRRAIAAWCLAIVVVMDLYPVSSAAGRTPELPLTAQGEALQAKYADMLGALKTELAAAAPSIDERRKEAFLAAHTAMSAVPVPPNPRKLKHAPPRYAPGNPVYAAAQSNALLAARAILSDVDTFLSSDRLDTKLAKCALLAHATPRGLALFAQQGAEQRALISTLLGDDALVKQVTESGGAYEGKYGQAMENYTAILKACTTAHQGFHQRWALASSLEHPDGNVKEEGKTAAEVMVTMYLDYAKAYSDGKLDPAFDTYSDFEYRFIFPHRSVQDVAWMREMMRNYRPDHIVNPDYKWRYCRIVKTDVPYTSNVKRPVRPDLGLTAAQDWFLEGGICGPRAFAGKLSTAAFGVPTRGARQTGHAAMSHWTPDGWTTVFGGHWTINRWRGRCGLDFVLETQARENPGAYMQVLRAQWLGDALDETQVNANAYGTGGGLWHALAFYKKLAIVEEARIIALAPTGEELSESNEEAIPEQVASIEMTEADRTIVLGENGVIVIPASACSKPTNSTDKIRFMKTIDGEGVQVHYNLGGNRPDLLKYTVEVPAAGTYELTARVVTVTVDRSFLLRLNRRSLVDIPLPYTKGLWEDTKPVAIELKEGRNRLEFTAKVPNKGVSIRQFMLTPQK